MKLMQRSRPLVILSVALWTACVHSKGRDESPTLGATKSPGDSGKPAAAPSPGGSPPPTANAGAPSIESQLAFVRAQSQAGSTFGEAEQRLVAALPSSPDPGSVTEAALAVGLVKTTLHRKPDEGGAPSLEQLCKQRGLNLAGALADNPLLAGYAFARQVLEALKVGTNGAPFQTEVTAALQRQASQWTELNQPATPPASPSPAADGATPDAGTPLPGPLGATPAGAPPSEDLVLTEAQQLADRGDYEAAIKAAGAIPEGSPRRAQAQEKIKEFSNMGVQDLRRKAAAAFQSAMPVSDPKTRAEYLRRAKGFLEEAITKFPDAAQLPTVKDNLRVISADLEKLESGAGH